jgi:hypothetical protein
MNPVMRDVFGAFEAVADRPTSINIDRTGVALPQGQHFQGIQRIYIPPVGGKTAEQRLIVISSSSNDDAYFVPCSMAEDWLSGKANAPKILATVNDTPAFNHAGGCQAFGSILAMGLEDLDNEKYSQVRFWDFGVNKPIPEMTIDRPGNGKTFTAGAIGMTSYAGGSLVAVGSFSSQTIDFYATEFSPRGGRALKFMFTWVADDANKSAWVDENFANYQNLNLITQADGQVFMVAFDRSGSSDWMDLYSVNLNAADPTLALRKMAKKHMYCSNGCRFDAGSGIFIASEYEFDVYAVAEHSGDYKTGTTINVNYFSGV